MKTNNSLHSQLVSFLKGGHAHITFDKAISGLPFQDIGKPVDGLSHTIWELTEHIRFAQYDILDFSRNPEYEAVSFPDDYWPANPEPDSKQQWNETIEAIQRDRSAMIDLLKDPGNDLVKPIEHGNGQTLLHEAILIVDHTGYHIGQIVQIRRLLGNW